MRKFSWYINRLKLMSIEEIMKRIFNQARSFNEKHFLKEKVNYKLLETRNFHFDSNDLQIIRKFYNNNPSLKKKLLNEASKLVQHKFSFFALNDKNLGEKINWHKDYLNEKICENKFYSDINFKDYKKNGDIKYIWELNRFMHFYPLIQAFIVTEDEKYANELKSQIFDWISNNEYLKGVNWTSSLEVSIRLYSWIWAYFSLKTCGYKFKKNEEKIFFKYLILHAKYICRHLSSHSSANNHLIGELSGLVLFSCLFKFENFSEKIIKKALPKLEKELIKQTFEDGLNKEQAFAYHLFVYDFTAPIALLLKKNNIKTSDKFLTTLKKMSQTLKLLCDESLNLPNIGDSDDGYVIKNSSLNRKSQIIFALNSASILFNENSLKITEELDEKTLLLAADNYEFFKNMKLIDFDKKSKYLKNSGYILFKDTKNHLLMDVGNLGFLSIAAHGHADALSLTLNRGGREFLIDSGTYSYHTKEKWRNYFKGTSAHNTLEVDGQNQSKTTGNFMWMQKADVEIEEIRLDNNIDLIRASHNGYIKQGIGIKHSRELTKTQDYILIKDFTQNVDKKLHNFSLNWHFSPDCKIEKIENNVFKIINNKETIYLRLSEQKNLAIKIHNGNKNPLKGWESKEFDKKSPTSTIEINIKDTFSFDMKSIIYFTKDFNNANIKKI